MSTITSTTSTSSDLSTRLRTFSFSEKTTVVIELGFRVTKVGFAGEAKPRSVVPTKVVSPTGAPSTESSKNILEIDNEAQLRFALIDFINHLFIRHILLTPKDKTVIISEPLFLPIWFRKMLLNVLFADIQIGSVFVAPGPLFSLFGLGWRSGLVVDCDAFETSVFPVFENVSILKAVESAPIGYANCVDHLRSTLQNDASWPGEVLTEQVLDDLISKAACFVNRFDRVAKSPDVKTTDVLYPSTFGGKYAPMVVPGSARECIGEPLFDSKSDVGSVTRLVLSSLSRCPVDVRKVLAGRLVLVGTCASLPGFGHRLIAELDASLKRGCWTDGDHSRKLPPSLHEKLEFKCALSAVPTENLVWFGASIFGNLEVATQRSISRDKYFSELKIGGSEFQCSRLLTADWLNTPSLIPYPGQENMSLSMDPTSSSC